MRLTAATAACVLAALTLAALAFAAAPASAAPACTQGLLESKLECRFGEEGAGVGQFATPEAVAVDNSSELSLDSSAGDVYVADRANNRIDKFSSDGEFLLAWGWGVADGKEELETCGPQGTAPVCHAGSAGGGAGQVDEPSGVAVDSAAVSMADGDVFVQDTSNHRVEKFTADGTFLLAWGEGVANGAEEAQMCGPEAAIHTCQAAVEPPEGTGEGPGEFEHMAPHAIAVDSAGTVYVGDVGRVQEFSDTGVFARQVTLTGLGFVEALAVNKAGDIFVMSGDGVREYEACASSCVGKELLANLRDPSAEGEESSLALGSAGELFVDTHGRLSEFEAAGEGQLAGFPSAAPQRGLAFGDQAGELYVLTPSEVQLLPPPSPGPLVESEEATAEPAGKATLHASFDAEHHPAEAEESVSYHFEYDTREYKQGEGPHGTSTAVEETSKAPSFQARQAEEAHLGGLLPDTTYHFRLVVTNAASETTAGADQTFTTLPALEIGAESATEVSATTAQLNADINPLGFRTEYHFEYGHTTAYENGSVPSSDASAGSGVVPVALDVALTGLAPATEYHYRVVAHNECEPLADPGRQCVFKGSDHTFTTQGASTPGLIDGRAWELVSPPDKHGASLEMSTAEAGLFQAAEDGDGISYFAEAPITTAPAGARSFAYSQLLSKRWVGGGVGGG
jgi:hypothetical protein